VGRFSVAIPFYLRCRDRAQGTNSARLYSLAGRYDNPIPTWFPAPIDCLKIPAQDLCEESTPSVLSHSVLTANTLNLVTRGKVLIPKHRKIRLTESNAKCRHKKIDL
jgi:hypothetical protein